MALHEDFDHPDNVRFITPREDEDRIEDDWDRISLAEIVAKIRSGELQPITPTILAVEGHMALFYAERINSLFGESGGGKTWVALAAIVETLQVGGRALMVDFEDTPFGIAERLVLLGITDDELDRFDYRNPTTGIGKGVDVLAAQGATWDLIVIDSTGEAMAAGSVDSNNDGEVAGWFKLARDLSRLPGGPAVIVLDHVPKATDAPSSYAIGSQRKRAAITGASYRVDTLKEPSRGKDGRLKLTVAKDRLGNRAKTSVAAEVAITSSATSVSLILTVSEAQAAAEAGEKFRPTTLMERVSRHLEEVGCGSKRTIEKAIHGKGTAIRLAVEVLEEEGWITAGAKGYEVVTPYRAPVDNSQARPASRRVPGASRDAAEEGASPRPGGSYTRDAGRASEGENHPSEAPSASLAKTPEFNPFDAFDSELFG